MRRFIASCAVSLALLAPAFAQTRLSQIPAASSPPALTDQLVAVIAGGTDKLVSINQLLSVIPLCAVGTTTCYFSSPNTTTTLLNRLQVGEVAKNGNTNFPMSPADWVEAILGTSVSYAQIASVQTFGGAGVIGAARTSDYRTAFSAASPATIGIEGIVKNDDTVGGVPIAVAVDGVTIANSNIGISLGSQLDVNSVNTPVTVGPYSGVPQGSTIGLLLTTGFDAPIATQNVSAAWITAPGRTGGPKWLAGGVCEDGSLVTTVGSGGDGVCISMAEGEEVAWQNNGATRVNEIWANATGINFNTPGVLVINGTSGVTCSGTPTASFASVKGIVTHC